MSSETSNKQAVSANPASRSTGHRNHRSQPHPMAGNFILMPSLLDYLTPDLTLPEQYFAQQANDDGMGPEKALMYAVLKDGIRCFYKYTGSTRRKYRKMSDEAEEWLAEDTWDDPFSFTVICDTLGIDSGCLRAKLLAWKDAELERRRMTGDTKSIQVGRSPFPVSAEEVEAYQAKTSLSFDVVDTEDGTYGSEQIDVDAGDLPAELYRLDTEQTPGAEPGAPEGWGEFEHMSLEELRLEERPA